MAGVRFCDAGRENQCRANCEEFDCGRRVCDPEGSAGLPLHGRSKRSGRAMIGYFEVISFTT